MPLLASKLRLQQSCPFYRALEIELLQWGEGSAGTRLPASATAARCVDSRQINPLALMPMLDDEPGKWLASIAIR